MKLVLITTTDMTSGRSGDFERMVQSIAASIPAAVSLKHVMLLQRCTEQQRQLVAASIPYGGAVVLCCPDRLPLSAARNIMLAHARESGDLSATAIVGFPDDDCWYQPGFLAALVAAFRDNVDLGLIVSRVSLTPAVSWKKGMERRATTADVLKKANSNSMFLRGNIVAAIGDFDSSLGLGTPNVSGEDTDFCLRASFAAREAVYVDLPLVGHKEPDLDSVTKYFGGNLLVARRYALRSPALFLQFARKLAVGGYLVLRKRLKVADFIKALQASAGSFGRNAG